MASTHLLLSLEIMVDSQIAMLTVCRMILTVSLAVVQTDSAVVEAAVVDVPERAKLALFLPFLLVTC